MNWNDDIHIELGPATHPNSHYIKFIFSHYKHKKKDFQIRRTLTDWNVFSYTIPNAWATQFIRTNKLKFGIQHSGPIIIIRNRNRVRNVFNPEQYGDLPHANRLALWVHFIIYYSGNKDVSLLFKVALNGLTPLFFSCQIGNEMATLAFTQRRQCRCSLSGHKFCKVDSVLGEIAHRKTWRIAMKSSTRLKNWSNLVNPEKSGKWRACSHSNQRYTSKVGFGRDVFESLSEFSATYIRDGIWNCFPIRLQVYWVSKVKMQKSKKIKKIKHFRPLWNVTLARGSEERLTFDVCDSFICMVYNISKSGIWSVLYWNSRV